MNDYFTKIQKMETTDAVFEEIKKLNDKLFKLNEASPMWQQVKGMIDLCHARQQELMAHTMEKLDKTPTRPTPVQEPTYKPSTEFTIEVPKFGAKK